MSEQATIAVKLLDNGASLPENYYLFISPDEPNEPDGCRYTAYLVNNTDEEIAEIKRSRFTVPANEQHIEPELIFRNIPPRSYVLIGAESDNDFRYKLYYYIKLQFREREESTYFTMYNKIPMLIYSIGLNGSLFSEDHVVRRNVQSISDPSQATVGAFADRIDPSANIQQHPDNHLMTHQLAALWYAKTGTWRPPERWGGYAEFLNEMGVTRIERGNIDKYDFTAVYKNPGEPDLIYQIVNKHGEGRVLYWSFGSFLKG